MLLRDGWRCRICGVQLTAIPQLDNTAHVAHRQPLAGGGDDSDTNLYASCARCNHKLGANEPELTDQPSSDVELTPDMRRGTGRLSRQPRRR